MTDKIVRGVVLRSLPYKENDIILTLFTEDLGIIGVICRGIRRARKHPAVYCQPFCYSEFRLFIGRSMPVADGADVIEQFYGLRFDLEKLSLAQYLADICSQLPRNFPDKKTLSLFLNSLYLLSENRADRELIKIVFELKYAAVHGFAPGGKRCSVCSEPAEKWVFGSGFLCSRCAGERGFTVSEKLICAVNFMISAEGFAPYRIGLTFDEILYLSKLTSQCLCYEFGCEPKSLAYYRKLQNFGDLK